MVYGSPEGPGPDMALSWAQPEGVRVSPAPPRCATPQLPLAAPPPCRLSDHTSCPAAQATVIVGAPEAQAPGQKGLGSAA